MDLKTLDWTSLIVGGIIGAIIGIIPTILASRYYFKKGLYIKKIKVLCKFEHCDFDIEELKTNGVGLKNVCERLRMFYDTENVMEITSEGPAMGTCITLLIPYEQ